MNIAIFPGSFDIFHDGHLYVLKKAKNFFDQIIVLVSNNPTKNHSLTLQKRHDNILEVLKNNNIGQNVVVSLNNGLTPQYCEEHKIKFIIRGIRDKNDLDYEKILAQEYLNINPNLKFIYFYADKKHSSFRSSTILANG